MHKLFKPANAGMFLVFAAMLTIILVAFTFPVFWLALHLGAQFPPGLPIEVAALFVRAFLSFGVIFVFSAMAYAALSAWVGDRD